MADERNDFYTYAFLREDRTPYYVGKGCGRRAYRTNLPNDRVLILKRNLTEDEAWKHETYMIFVFGRKDIGTGILRNLSDGGSGGSSGCVRSKETRRKMALAKKGDNNPMKRPSVKAKVSKALTGKKNPEHSKRMTGRKATEETRKKMSETHKGRAISESQLKKLRQKFKCLVTGHISTAAGLTQWQNKRGIDLSLRTKIND